jgi:tRNA(fMet)-specific endonuclease VapC
VRYLLDTNIVSHLLRDPHGQITDRIRSVGEESVCTSIIVTAELRYGVAKKASPKLAAQLEAVLSALEVLPLEPPTDEVYGRIRTQLEREGTPIGGNDLLIAAQALALEYTLVTDNACEFRRIDGLSIENWLRT